MFRYCNQLNFKNMQLVTFYSLIEKNRPHEENFVHPNNELNFALIDLWGIQPESLLKLLVRDDLKISEEDRLLISASVFGRVDLGIWRFHMNRFLKLKNCPALAEIDTEKSKQSILHSLKFTTGLSAHSGPLISIIMSAFNAEATLKMAVCSLMEQTYNNIEILICDDASTDDTLRIARSLAEQDRRIRVFRSSRNQGPYNIRNAMIREARAEIITFQDADDISLPNRIFEQHQAYISTGAHMIFCKWLRLRGDGGIFFFADQAAHRMALISLMASKELFEQFGFYRSVRCGGDSEFYEKVRDALGEQAVYIVDKPLLFASWTGTSLTRTPGFESNEAGYRSPARRKFSHMASMQRILGNEIVPDAEIDDVLVSTGMYCAPSAIEEVRPDLVSIIKMADAPKAKVRKPRKLTAANTTEN